MKNVSKWLILRTCTSPKNNSSLGTLSEDEKHFRILTLKQPLHYINIPSTCFQRKTNLSESFYDRYYYGTWNPTHASTLSGTLRT